MFNAGEIENILKIAKEAGDLIMEYYQGYKDLDIIKKNDDSLVTKADFAANDVIISHLKNLFPNIAIVSEENSWSDNIKAAQNSQYFMIDPLDGTSSFIEKSDEWTVNIALIKDFHPVFGVIYLPAKDLMYFTNENNQGCRIENFSKVNRQIKIINTTSKKNNLRIICTKREPEKSQIINDLANRNISVKEIISIASSYKFCLIAEGKADLYPRKINIKAWDVAAGHAIVNKSGGSMIDLSTKQELQYQFIDSFDIPFFEVF